MNTKNFRSKQEFREVALPKLDDRYIIGMDLGYGQVKCATEKTLFIFPSYVKRLYEMVNIDDPNDLLYRDGETGDVYIIGYEAQNMMTSSDTDAYSDMFSRKRYNTKTFSILYHVAMGLALYNKTDDRPIFIESGLPSSYVEGDQGPLMKAFTKPAEFYLKWGQRKWRKFTLNVERSMVNIISQPFGSLYSTLVGMDGKFVPNAREKLKKNILIIDAGFKTVDLHGTQSRAKSAACKESLDRETGMYQVLADTSKQIMEAYDEDIQVTAMQKNLEKGTILHVSLGEDGYVSKEEDFSHMLEESNRKVCQQTLKQIMDSHDGLKDYETVIVTGGTGEAWFDIIKNYLKGLSHLEIVPANRNTKLPFSYSNAIGYYLYAYTSHKPKKQG